MQFFYMLHMCFFKGTLEELQRLTGWDSERVLYFGDHVFADLADLSSHHGWRTGAVIQVIKSYAMAFFYECSVHGFIIDF